MTKSTSSSSQNYEYRMYNAETDKLLKWTGLCKIIIVIILFLSAT
jgi:hypothetical protein